jgi:hypothetical protein
MITSPMLNFFRKYDDILNDGQHNIKWSGQEKFTKTGSCPANVCKATINNLSLWLALKVLCVKRRWLWNEINMC